MKFRVLVFAALALSASCAALAAQKATQPDLTQRSLNGKVPADVILSETDITNRPYRVLGDVTVTVNKVGIVDVPPIRTKVENALRVKAAEMGADAIVEVRYVEHGFGVIHASMEGLGRAVVFLAPGAAAAPAASAAPGQPASPAQAAVPAAPRQIPSQADMKAKVKAYFDAINAGDADTAIAFYASDATIEDPLGSQIQQGRAAVEAFVRGVVSRKTKFDIMAPVRGSNTNVAAVTLVAHTGGGTLNIIEVYTFHPDGHFSSMKAIWGNEDRGN